MLGTHWYQEAGGIVTLVAAAIGIPVTALTLRKSQLEIKKLNRELLEGAPEQNNDAASSERYRFPHPIRFISYSWLGMLILQLVLHFIGSPRSRVSDYTSYLSGVAMVVLIVKAWFDDVGETKTLLFFLGEVTLFVDLYISLRWDTIWLEVGVFFTVSALAIILATLIISAVRLPENLVKVFHFIFG
jgi:hypothetical protein